jgi:nicotinate-nucleotide adenylyltransferase
MQELKLVEKYIQGELSLDDVLVQVSIFKEQELLEKIAQSFNLFAGPSFDLNFYSKSFLPSDEVALFPGSFHPWHQGHDECLRQCPYKNIVIMPDRNPEKSQQTDRALATYLKLLCQKEVRGHYLNPAFLLLTESNPTFNWIKRINLKKKILLMGDDSYMSILSWIKGSDLVMELHQLIVLPRFFQKEDYKMHEDRIRRLNPKIEVTYLSDHPFKQISSRSIRTNY